MWVRSLGPGQRSVHLRVVPLASDGVVEAEVGEVKWLEDNFGGWRSEMKRSDDAYCYPS